MGVEHNLSIYASLGSPRSVECADLDKLNGCYESGKSTKATLSVINCTADLKVNFASYEVAISFDNNLKKWFVESNDSQIKACPPKFSTWLASTINSSQERLAKACETGNTDLLDHAINTGCYLGAKSTEGNFFLRNVIEKNQIQFLSHMIHRSPRILSFSSFKPNPMLGL